jgi:hypothetical protein
METTNPMRNDVHALKQYTHIKKNDFNASKIDIIARSCHYSLTRVTSNVLLILLNVLSIFSKTFLVGIFLSVICWLHS